MEKRFRGKGGKSWRLTGQGGGWSCGSVGVMEEEQDWGEAAELSLKSVVAGATNPAGIGQRRELSGHRRI